MDSMVPSYDEKQLNKVNDEKSDDYLNESA